MSAAAQSRAARLQEQKFFASFFQKGSALLVLLCFPLTPHLLPWILGLHSDPLWFFAGMTGVWHRVHFGLLPGQMDADGIRQISCNDSLFPYYTHMLAKLTSKNQITLPKSAVAAMGEVSHFDVKVDSDRLVLTPARLGAADAVRKKLEELGITEADVADAVAWARKSRRG